MQARQSSISFWEWVSKLLHPRFLTNSLKIYRLKRHSFRSTYFLQLNNASGMWSSASWSKSRQFCWRAGVQGNWHSFPIWTITILPSFLSSRWACLKKAEWSLLKWKEHFMKMRSNYSWHQATNQSMNFLMIPSWVMKGSTLMKVPCFPVLLQLSSMSSESLPFPEPRSRAEQWLGSRLLMNSGRL